jgi:hypothetical protein
MPFGAATPSAHPPYDSRPVELELRMATASAGRRRRRPLENAAVFFGLLVLPLSQRPFVPMRSRFRVGLVRVACSCRRCNAGNVRNLTCQKSVPARSCTRIARRPRNPAGDCRHSGVQLQVLPRVPNQRPKTQNRPKSPLRKGPSSPHCKAVCHVGTECLACNVLRCTSSIFIYTAGKLQGRLQAH